MTKIVIGVVGQIGAGKDAAIEFLEKRGFVNFSLSDQIREVLKRKGNLDFTREEIQKMANKRRKEEGHDYWAKKAWKKAMESGQEKLIISSIRHPAEVTFLKKQKNLYLLAMVASQRLRYQRKLSSTRSDDQDILTWEKFKKMDDYEFKGANGYSQQVEKTVSLADFRVENNGTKKDLQEKVNAVLDQIRGGKNNQD
ncbi:MAG TPA: hypothetical protein VMX77_00340 [Candidatus Bathyarchaeia archaeon]|nr:hypothetical protein [Candidatus Bathyarchaeia archaeon]